MAEIRVLTVKGVEAFIDFVDKVRVDPDTPVPVEAIGKEPLSKEFSPHIDIDIPEVATRMELAKYLAGVFKENGVGHTDIVDNMGLWSWLALVCFDMLCPKADGARRVRETARYVCSADYTDYYRHLVAAAWYIFHLHGDKSRLFLCNAVSEHNDFVEQLASRQDIITNGPLIEVFDRMYWDSSSARTKVGAQSKTRPGNFRRLLSFVQQVDLTYDLRAMKPDHICALLPPEFDVWKAA